MYLFLILKLKRNLCGSTGIVYSIQIVNYIFV